MSSIDFKEVHIQKLSRIYDTSKFDCGDDDINDFLRNDAILWQEKKLTVTHIFIYHERIMGFFCLSADSIRLNNTERKDDGHLNQKRISEIPAIKIGRLGRDKHFKDNKVGVFILEWAIGYILKLSEALGVRFITVDAYKNRLDWYKTFGFIPNLHKDYELKDNVSMRYSLYNPSNNNHPNV